MKIIDTTISRALAAAVVFTAASGAAATAGPQDGRSIFGVTSAGVTYGPYGRLEFGGSIPSLGDAYWESPGASDPRVDFDADAENSGFGALAVGYDWQNGWRADMSVFGTGTSDVTAPCSSVSDGTSCATHASIDSASVSTVGVMTNVFYAPLEARGSSAVLQPFVVAGLGLAQNTVGTWTRSNATSSRPTRTFEGDTSTDLAWSVGVGASFQVSKPGRWPIVVEAAWRYYDFGSASGGSTPLAGNGTSEPRTPFTFDNSTQVVSIGVRIPLERF